jgi:hypothetical protein
MIMKIKAGSVVASLAAVLTLGLSGGVASAGTVPHLPGYRGGLGCDSSLVRPRVFLPFCNDGSGTVAGLHWSSWGASAHSDGKWLLLLVRARQFVRVAQHDLPLAAFPAVSLRAAQCPGPWTIAHVPGHVL